MPVAQTVQSPSNIPRQLSDGNDQGTIFGLAVTADGNPDMISFYGATPVAPQTPAHNAATGSAGSTTEAFTNTTYTGGVGTTAYTVGDLVKILKTLGLLIA